MANYPQEFFAETLARARAYRALMTFDPAVAYPPMAVVAASHVPTPVTWLRPAAGAPVSSPPDSGGHWPPGTSSITLMAARSEPAADAPPHGRAHSSVPLAEACAGGAEAEGRPPCAAAGGARAG